MYKQLFVFALALTVAYAGIIHPFIGIGGVSYTQRLQSHVPLGVVGIGHIGHFGHHHGHFGHHGHGHHGFIG